MDREMPCISVRLQDAETVRGLLSRAKLLVSARAGRDGDELQFPVADLEKACLIMQEQSIQHRPGFGLFELRDPQRRIPYDHIGGIAILKEGGVQEARDVMARHPKVRTVYLNLGVQGPYRTPELMLLAGEDDPFTSVKEHGMTFEVDVRSAYFSPRLASERERISSMIEEGETVIDMFCGVGPFSISMARAGATVHAIDINPSAIELLKRNMMLNKVEGSISVHSGDASDEVPELVAKGVRPSRIVMNHPTQGIDFIDTAINAMEKGVIHLYLMVQRGAEEIAVDAIKDHLGDREAEVKPRLVRSVSASGDNWVYDIILNSAQ